ncbi:MAG: hypothetical protein IPP78_11995 [Holophagaceae bacterium]|nr:hypothetical protein [Holophagaceae bacterium]
MIEVLIVTGPLGAGKTTAVNRLLKREIASDRRVAVLINEFGSVSVDEALVNAERPELAGIANLINGCVCCSLRDDVVSALAAWCDGPTSERPGAGGDGNHWTRRSHRIVGLGTRSRAPGPTAISGMSHCRVLP